MTSRSTPNDFQQPAIIATGTNTAVHIIETVHQWDAIETEWNDLFNGSPTASPPLHFDWLREWWRSYGPRYGGALRILLVRRFDRLIGILPLYEPIAHGKLINIRSLQFLSTGEAEHEETAAEYLDLLHVPGEGQNCVEAISLALAHPGFPTWHKIELHDMSADSPLAGLQGRSIANSHFQVQSNGDCHIADLTQGFESYMGQLSPKTRKHARRLLRAAESSTVQFEVASSEEDTNRFFDALIMLHQHRWTARGRPGCFAAGRFTEFHRTLARLWAPDRKALLAKLELSGQPLAVIYGFVTRDRFHFYQSGISVEGSGAIKSPGMAALLLLMQYLDRHGIGYFDFLKGSSFYKQRLSTQHQSLASITAVRPGFETAVYNAALHGRQVLRRIARAVAGPAGVLGPVAALGEYLEVVDVLGTLGALI